MSMNELSHGNRPSAMRTLILALRHRLPLEGETALFILASALDAMMTRYLLVSGGSGDKWFVESNPIPRYFLESWGLDGLTYFKFALVALVSVICQIIARRRVEVARRVLNFASIVVLGVVIYSVVLMARHM
ncbi:MAG: DUF5658 family protein [Deltaproteobacteria bacterium]